MKRRHLLIVSLLLSALHLAAAPSFAAQKKAQTIALDRILFGNTLGSKVAPSRLWANEEGGELIAEVTHTKTFVEQLRIRWRFGEKNVSLLKNGDEFKVFLSVEFLKAGSEKDDPHIRAGWGRANYQVFVGTNNGGTCGLIYTYPEAAKNLQKFLGGLVTRVYARKEGAGKSAVGTNSGTFTVLPVVGGEGRYAFLYFTINGLSFITRTTGSKAESLNYEICYVFREGITPKEVVATVGDARPPTQSSNQPVGKDDSGRVTIGTGNNGRDSADQSGNLPQQTIAPPTRAVSDVTQGGPVPPWLVPAGPRGPTWPTRPSRTYRPPNWTSAEANWPPVGPPPGRPRGNNPGLVIRRNNDGTTTIQDPPWMALPNPRNGPSPNGVNARNGGARILLADRRRVPTGEEVTIPIYLFYPRGTANLSFDVEYDTKVAQPVGSPEQGAIIRLSKRFRSNTPSPGLLKIAFAEPTALDRSGIVTFSRFRAVGSPGQRTTLMLRVTELEDPSGLPLAMDLYDGEIEIIRADEALPGDNDNTGRLTVWNAQSALDMDVRLIPEDLRLDVDGDGKVSSSDARIIFQRLEIDTAGNWRAGR